MPDPDRQIVAFYNLENFFDTLDDPEKDDNDFIHYDSPDRRGIDVALLYDRNILTVLSHEKIKVVLDADEYFTTRDILYVKAAFEDDDVVHFFINHWPSRREGTRKTMPKRIAAARSLYTKTSDILSSDPMAKIFIMGDFNDLPVSRSIIHTLKDEFYNLALIPYRKKLGTVFAKGRWLMFDQMMISQGMMNAQGYSINAPRLTIHFDKKLLFYDKKRAIYRPNRSYSGKKFHGGYSDHLPVFVTMEKIPFKAL